MQSETAHTQQLGAENSEAGYVQLPLAGVVTGADGQPALIRDAAEGLQMAHMTRPCWCLLELEIREVAGLYPFKGNELNHKLFWRNSVWLCELFGKFVAPVFREHNPNLTQQRGWFPCFGEKRREGVKTA